jgi:hypothetical protein
VLPRQAEAGSHWVQGLKRLKRLKGPKGLKRPKRVQGPENA